MIENVIILSLIITAIHVSMLDGMIFGFVGDWLRRLPYWLRNPLFECLACMGGVYTLILYPVLFGLSWLIIPTMLCVIGLNSIIEKFLNHENTD